MVLVVLRVITLYIKSKCVYTNDDGFFENKIINRLIYQINYFLICSVSKNLQERFK